MSSPIPPSQNQQHLPQAPASGGSVESVTSGGGGGGSNASNSAAGAARAVYPLPVSLSFCPGGVLATTQNRPPSVLLNKVSLSLIQQAATADSQLQSYIHESSATTTPTSTTDPPPTFLPSLSVLAEAIFGRLTGCPPQIVKEWSDAIIVSYYNLNPPPGQPPVHDPSISAAFLLKALAPLAIDDSNSGPRPCGYVFKRGDIAWNCRTCQTDPTCVICDSCFRNSKHDGHEVYFHRTTPGGCCDCGDAEAWKREGCCEQHRPDEEATSSFLSGEDNALEAVRMAENGQELGQQAILNSRLPKQLLAALGVLIGAAVHALVDAVDGAGIAADPVQWRMKWADEASRLINRTSNHDDYFYTLSPVATPANFLVQQQHLPEGYRLHLRLHNDDVHTFDEVIDALHESRQLHRHNQDALDPLNHSLVPVRDNATQMTHYVDSDGQVTVKPYSLFANAMLGYRRLKSRGLHCAVVSTAQVQAEFRARALVTWLAEIAGAHPAAQALVVHALVQVREDHELGGVHVWHQARCLPVWAGMDQKTDAGACQKRFQSFPPHLQSSYMTREEAELLHGIALSVNPTGFWELTGASDTFYSRVPYRLPSERYKKSPHALWGTLPSHYSAPVDPATKHPLLQRLVGGAPAQAAARPSFAPPDFENRLTESIYVVDLDLRKQQEAERITTSVFPHKLPGLNMISGIGTVRANELDIVRPPLPSPMDLRHLLATSSFRAPVSPILLLLLLDPYPTKQMRATIHALFLSLLTDSRFRSRFAGALGISYRPLSTLFCAGVGTEADTPLHFTVQIFTAGSLVRALGNAAATEKLLLSDKPNLVPNLVVDGASIGVFASPISHTIVRCIHTNLLGATKEVNMILNNTSSANDDNSQDDTAVRNDSLLPALTYVAGEHPLMTPLPAAPDDGFLDSRSTRHKRLPHLLRDLEYVIETPGTGIRLLSPHRFPVYQGPALSARGEDVLSFPSVYARMLRLGQGMDPQKRKISGGHVEYEQNRWLEAFGLSLNFAGTRDALAESPISTGTSVLPPGSNYEGFVISVREATGNIIVALLREIKLWLYREGMLETGLLVSPAHGSLELAQAEALQRSTLHVSKPHAALAESEHSVGSGSANTVALACATGVKMTETQLSMIENVLKLEAAERQHNASVKGFSPAEPFSTGPVMGDWLRVPHAPLAGDSLSFHLPLHRALAKCVRSICSLVVPQNMRTASPSGWWKIPVLDGDVPVDPHMPNLHPLVPLIRTTLRTSNCRVVWSTGPECSTPEAQRRRARSRNVSANVALVKILHSLADHPMRCIAAAQQIERHLWARNGSSVAGMAINYSSTPLCRSFRDLDILLVQLSAAGMSCGLGARRVFVLLLSRFSMDGYLCDPERRTQAGMSDHSGGTYSSNIVSTWVNPPRLQDAEHAVVLSESLFSVLCVVVSELPPPPPISSDDDSSLRQTVRRELLHALATEARSHSEAMNAAMAGISRREETEGSTGTTGGAVVFRQVFTEVLGEIAKQKSQRSNRAASGPPTFELNPTVCDEYDPTFFHLKRQEHQHAMDVISRLRKQKWGDDKDAAETHCLPLVCAPPKAHPRFLPCRLLLHIPAMDAAIRRALLFALTGGSWLPPAEPYQPDDTTTKTSGAEGGGQVVGGITLSSSSQGVWEANIPCGRRSYGNPPSAAPFSLSRRPSSTNNESPPFSQVVVAASSVSFLEVLQLLTLQVHTLEECASLHRTLPDLDGESRALSAGLSINSYLGRLVYVPESLVDVWALRPFPEGPLKSRGSGEKRGSVLGFLIALYEHRADHAAVMDSDAGDAGAADGHGGARALGTSGLKWLLRFVNALVDGAPSVGAATKAATIGIPIKHTQRIPSSAELGSPSWTIDDEVRLTIRAMLANLNDLWPKEREKASPADKTNTKNKEVGKAAQNRMLELMKRKQAAFAATIGPTSAPTGEADSGDSEADLCIICRCDDADGENNGPLGYLGHVQRSRVSEMRALIEASNIGDIKRELLRSFRVVGHMGCQLRESEAMDSKPLTCLPKGSVVTVLESKVSKEYGVLSRRVMVRHVSRDPQTGSDVITEGWASVQSSQGYVILSALSSLCYTNSSWGGTRPIIKQCGHAAHLKCVETHTLSLHQRAAGDQPYDGRFAANIADGEFLCPLCKQLSNILIPRDNTSNSEELTSMDVDQHKGVERSVRSLVAGAKIPRQGFRGMSQKAFEDFGAHLYIAMGVPWEKASGSSRARQQQWNTAIQKWDYEEDNDDLPELATTSVRNILRLLRKQLISWAAVGHSAASSESASRGLEEVLPFGINALTNDPWQDYEEKSRDSHPMLLALRRMLTASSGLLEVLYLQLQTALGGRELTSRDVPVIGSCLGDILEGVSWLQLTDVDGMSDSNKVLWSELTALVAAMPCHVARDGVLPQRCESRATAAGMWASKGLGTNDKARGEPPAPLAVSQAVKSGLAPLAKGWGTMDPHVDADHRSSWVPFRPAVACAFLYKPLLVWDLYTLSGAVFSSALATDSRGLPTSEELLKLSRYLLLGRMIQCIVTPCGIEIPDEADVEHDDFWSGVEIQVEGQALKKLVGHSRFIVSNKSVVVVEGDSNDLTCSADALLSAVGSAILPFARALILMLRACSSAVRDRSGKNAPTKSNAADKMLDSILFDRDAMEFEDGFYILKAMQCPLPSELMNPLSPWKGLVDRWLTSVVGFELHHGSKGFTIFSKLSADGTPADAGSNGEGDSRKPPARMLSSGSKHGGAMDIEVEAPNQPYNDPFAPPNNLMMNDDMDDSDDEVMEADQLDDDAEEMVGFVGLGPSFSSNMNAGGADGGESDENSSSGSEGDGRDADPEFAHVSRSPILPFQPSTLALQGIGPGRVGASFDFATASTIMSDMSHIGLIHQKHIPTFSLIRLPKNFVELYNVVNKVKGRDDPSALDESEDHGGSETAICLLTGTVMRSGSSRRGFSRSSRPPGACTLHARKHGSGTGIFFLVQKCTVLLMHNNKSAYSPSIYVDEHGEEDPGLRRGRPLYLNESRYRSLEALWRQQGIPREVAQIRSTSDRVIRDNWY